MLNHRRVCPTLSRTVEFPSSGINNVQAYPLSPSTAVLLFCGFGLVVDRGQSFGLADEVSEGAILTFNGDSTIQEVGNVNILLENFGSTE